MVVRFDGMRKRLPLATAMVRCYTAATYHLPLAHGARAWLEYDVTKKVCVIEGDDAAPEAVQPTVELLQSMELDLEFLRPMTGEQAIARHGTGFPEEARLAIEVADTTLFGATSGKTSGAVHILRREKQTYANVRPAKWLPGFKSPMANPQGIDYIIVRENLEDLYLGVEGDLAELEGSVPGRKAMDRSFDLTQRGRYALKIITEKGTRRVARVACRLAARRKESGHPGKVTCTAKYNLLRQTDGLFAEVTRQVVEEFGGLQYEELIVDNFARALVASPHDFDVVVMPNLYGDILSDTAAGTIGGLGLAPSGCYGDNFAYFEPVHGTAPDIAGKGIINPTATILSAAMMLEYLGMPESAARVEQAVARVYADGGTLTPDQGGTASTTEFAEAVTRAL